MLKLSGSFYKLLFATLLVFFCLNGHQLVYAEDLKLDKKNLKATVEVPVNTQTPATGSSASTHSFDLKFDVGKASDYDPAKKFILTVGKSCKLQTDIVKDQNVDVIQFYINTAFITYLQKLTITDKGIIPTPAAAVRPNDPPVVLCDGSASSGGSVVFESIAGDSSKSTIYLEISGGEVDQLPDDFKITSTEQVQKAAGEDSNSGGGLGTGAIVGIVVGIIGVVGVIGLVIAGVIFGLRYLKKKKNNNDGDEMNDEPEKEKEPKGMVKKKEESIVKKTVEAQKTEEKV